ncbi:mucin-19-like [Stylophora pistillata]|uniref:mucin-19-like n=1 Tax=Stylophora pistillata TaxID=50429 RepID=UPI000C0558AA|nr:mucin-19-like [Stylophora pistillata]
MHYVSIFLLAYTFLLEVVSGGPGSPQFKDTSVLSSFHRERRWLIEKVRPLNITTSSDSLRYNKYVQLWKIRQSLAAARHTSSKTFVKRSSDRDYLDRIASFIKEKEDASLRPAGSAKVVFLLDGSGKIGKKELNSYRLFVKEVYENLNIPTRGITFGLLECGSRHYTQRNILPRNIQSSKVLDLTLDKLVPVSGSCELGKSLQILNKNVFVKMPNGSPKAVVVVMAGKSVDEVHNAAKELRRIGVRVVAIGVGGQADMKQLATITDSPFYAFKVPVVQYLPAMSGTVVGFLNEVTDSRVLSANLTVPDPSAIQKEKHSGYYDEEKSTDANEIEEAPYTDNDLLQGLPPILDQLDGDKSAIDSWISALGGESRQYDASSSDSNVHPSQRPPTTGNFGTHPTHHTYNIGPPHAAALLNDWNDEGFTLNPTSDAENPLYSVNSINDSPHYVLQDSASITQVPVNPLPNNNGSEGQVSPGQTGGKVTTQGSGTNGAMSPSTASTNGSVQGGVSQGQGTTAGSNGAASPPIAGNPIPVGENQGNGIPSEASPSSNGVGSPGTSENPNQKGGGQANGVSGGAPAASSSAVSPGTAANPNKAGGNQVSGSVPQTTTGSVANPNSSGSSTNSGPGGGGGTSGGVSSPLGPVPVIQAPLLSIPVLPIQTIPIQALPSIQTAGSENFQKPKPQTANNTNQRESNGETGQTPTPTTSSAVAAPNKGNQVGNNEKGPGELRKPSTSPGNQNSSGTTTSKPEQAGNGSNQALNPSKPTPTNKSSAKQEPTSAPAETSAKSGTSENPEPTTPLAGTSNKEISSGKTHSSKNKPTSTTAIKGGAPDSNSSHKKPSIKEGSQSHQQQPIVLCQIVCGPGCCPLISKTKPTVPTTKETTTLKPKKTTKPTKEAVPEVLAGPPVPIHYTQRPGWFPQNPAPLPIPPNSLPLGTDPGAGSINPRLEMYMNLPPATSAPKISSFPKNNHDIFAGHCEDYHPDCPSFLMSGLCDQPNPFLEVFNVREVCMRSCGVCNSFVKHGQKDTFGLHKKEKKPEDIGFPEYSKKFL